MEDQFDKKLRTITKAVVVALLIAFGVAGLHPRCHFPAMAVA